jgi:single-stranded-DNA-specific exonuclease
MTANEPLLGYPPLLRTLLRNRGIESDEEAEMFLNPDYVRDIKDPLGILNMEKAARRILRAMDENERIVIYGDYDCDGIPGSVILHDLLRKIGYANFENYIPHRHLEGYGLNTSAIDGFAARGAGLIVTVDCGIADHAEVRYAQELGIDVIVTDHHLPQGELPPAFAVVDSKQEGDTYWDNMLCGAGVAWKLAQAILKLGRAEGKFSNIPNEWEKWLLDMVGLSTIADMVPLRRENRALAHFGLTVLRRSLRPGLQELLRKAGIEQRYLTEDDIGFTIAPRVNAASRMDVPLRAFEMFAATDPEVANPLADYLATLNDTRKTEVAMMMKEIHAHLKDRELREVIVVGSPKWRVGIVGLAANQVAERYGRPAFVWGREGSEIIKGSCRSEGTVNVFELMMRVEDGVFIDRGGHEFSGGFSVHHDAVHTLEDALVRAYMSMEHREKKVGDIKPEAQMSLHDVNKETMRQIALLAPFGEGNPKPIFLFSGVTVRLVEKFGKTKNHLRLHLIDDKGDTASAIGFFMTPELVGVANGDTIDLLATFEESRFRGKVELRLRIVSVTVR